jgi:ABC-type multidrug transport system ATPase subunit
MSEPVETDVALAARGRGLKLTGLQGLVYGPVDFDIPSQKLTVVSADPGSGRTSFLLTLAGRMKPDTPAELNVLGFELPKHRNSVQRLVGIAGFSGIDDLDGSLSSKALLKERADLLTPWYRPAPRLDDDRYEELMLPVYGDRPLPDAKKPVRELGELDEMLVRTVIALVGKPKMLIVDDVDRIEKLNSRDFYFQRLEALKQTGLSIIASVVTSTGHAENHHHVFALPNPGTRQQKLEA